VAVIREENELKGISEVMDMGLWGIELNMDSSSVMSIAMENVVQDEEYVKEF
jgi:hypothetical protein